jgi:DNA-binding NarL/FixJ family response regulator
MIDTASHRRIRSLVVDDDGDYRLLIRIWLERVEPFRYEVVAEAASGEECLDQAAIHRPALILLDMTMPRTDPDVLIPELSKRHPEATVVVLSGFDAERVEERVVACGAHAYLEKASDIALFRRRLDRIVFGSEPVAPPQFVELAVAAAVPLDSVPRIR